MLEDFDAFNLESIPRNQNKHDYRLADIGAQFDILGDIRKEKVQQYVKVVVRPSILDNNIHWQVFDIDE